ncbi:hypothetical protein KM043_014417 [Ampulex compressa]|nr:hypothetical protein KM043_014417 [Ampulex compressa]
MTKRICHWAKGARETGDSVGNRSADIKEKRYHETRLRGILPFCCAEHKLHTSGPYEWKREIQRRKDKGTDACTCSQVLVKAVKLPKPLLYASPRTINEAAQARALTGKLQTGGGFGVSSPAQTTSSKSGIFGFGGSFGSSSSSSSSASASGTFGYLTSGLSPVKSHDQHYYPGPSTTTATSACGCGKKTASLGLGQLLSLNGYSKVAPSFQPIGDLCYPNQVDSRSGKIVQTTTKVTPAYPGKIQCSCNNNVPYDLDVNVIGQQAGSVSNTNNVIGNYNSVDLQNLVITDFSGTDNIGITSGYSTNSGAGPYLGAYDSSSSIISSGGYDGLNSRTIIGEYNGPSSVTILEGYDGSGSVTNFEGYGSSSSVTGGYTGSSGNLGVFSGSSSGSNAGGSSGIYVGGGIGGSYSGDTITIFDESNSASGQVVQDTTSRTIEGCYSDTQSGTDARTLQYTYPSVPADAVSLTLAYKNINPSSSMHKYGGRFVPEDKLSFGHRKVPTDVKQEKKTPDIPEEKLQTVDKPVVELKVVRANPIVVATYNQEQQKLAELEAFERQSMVKQEKVDETQGTFMTYGDLGYQPVDAVISRTIVTKPGNSGVVTVGTTEQREEAPCGPLGPPLPGYVPGNIYVHREVIETENKPGVEEEYFVEETDSDEDENGSSITAGLMARMRSSASKYGKKFCAS